MFKKTLLATATTAALLGPLAASAAGDMGQGTITFTGSVTEAPCTISAADTNLAVELGAVSKKQLDAAGHFGPSVPIDIHLSGCQFAAAAVATNPPLLSKVSIKIAGQSSADGYIPNASGDATNTKIQLLNADGTKMNLTTGGTSTEMHNGNGNVFSMFARLIADGGPATAGSVSSKVTYMLDYK